jgi:predicted metal-dependent hydrolase
MWPLLFSPLLKRHNKHSSSVSTTILGQLVIITDCSTSRQASGVLNPDHIAITLPKQWAYVDKSRVALQLVKRLLKRQAKRRAILEKITQATNGDTERLNLTTTQQVNAFVRQINAETFDHSGLAEIRVGRAKRSRLAQVNRRTGVITISKFCLPNVPKQALRYLIIHELAHIIQPGHPPAFWQLVAQFCPDYKLQRQIIQAHHQAQVHLDDTNA